MKNKNLLAVFFALLAAFLYSLSIPFSKIIENKASPIFLASLFYLGAGIGIFILSLFIKKKDDEYNRIEKHDYKYIIYMVILDIIAPILMMYGVKIGNASSASLLNNFEIVATSLFAFIIFKEKISNKLIIGILLILLSSILLTFDSTDKFSFSLGSILVLLATISWGFENNCTKQLSNKNTYTIVTIKGLSCGTISLLIALLNKDAFPEIPYILLILAVGFFSYGLSIFFYIKSQKFIGAAKTSAFYSINPFIGSLLGLFLLHESISSFYIYSFILMIIGTIFVIYDTLSSSKKQ